MTFKTGLRKTVEAVRSRNFSYRQDNNLQASVFSARLMVVLTMKLYLLSQQGFPVGRTGKLPGDTAELTPSVL